MTTTREAALEAALRNIEDYALAFPDMETVSDMATAALSTPATEPQGYVEITEEMIVAGRKAADDQYYKWRGFGPREEGQGLDGMHFIVSEALRAALAARPDPQPAADTRGVVKPLVWECVGWSSGDGVKGENDDTWEAEVPTNDAPYCIEWFGGGVFHVNPPVGNVIVASSLACAKAAAQADYENRILSAIICNATPAQSDKIADAARVLLEAADDVMTGFAIDVMRANRLRDGKRIGYQPAIIAALRALAGKGE